MHVEGVGLGISVMSSMLAVCKYEAFTTDTCACTMY